MPCKGWGLRVIAVNRLCKLLIMTDYIFIKVALCCAVFGWAWVEVLTPDRSIFDGVKAYYPLRLEKPLKCAHCLSGWLSFFITCSYYICNYKFCNYVDIAYLALMPLFTMAIVQVLASYEK
mgnify:FL=1